MNYIEFAFDRIVGGLVLEAAIPITVILGIATRWCLGLIHACLAVGRKLSGDIGETGFQNSITPPWSTNASLVLWGLLLTVIFTTFFNNGFVAGIGLVILLIVVHVISGILFIPGPESQHYLLYIFHSLVNRRTDYRRDGDVDREEAVSFLVDRLLELYGPEMFLPKKRQS